MKKTMLLLTVLVLVLTASTTVFANTFDIVPSITTAMGELTTQFWAVVGVVIPVVLAIVGGKLVITKGIQIFKTLTGRA